MKLKLVALGLMSALSASSIMAAPNDLFFSEYIEGSSNNKALEIANLSDNAIDLTNYQIAMYFNGSESASLTFDLTGSVDTGEVFVVAQANASDAILSQADQTQGSGWFNGDDAIVLLKDGVIIDSIGQIGVDPGSEWGSALNSTQNNTLRRHLEISSGDSIANDAFDPATEWTGFDNDSFDNLGKLDDVNEPVEQTSCGDPADFIHHVQGTGIATSMAGSPIQVEGIVVGDFQGSEKLRGFFLQEEDSDADLNPLTSEGIFVYDNNFVVDVEIGDKVRVSGVAGEYSGMTQVTNVSDVQICAVSQSVTSTSVSLPFTEVDSAESVEGMLVHFEQALTVSENYNLGRYGELLLSNGRLMNPTNEVLPGLQAIAMQAQNDLNRIVLDDGSSRQNPLSIPFPQPQLSAFNSVRGGDTVQNLSGVMHQSFGAYRIQVNTMPDFEASNTRTSAPSEISGSIKIASFNVLNYFNGDGLGGGYPTERGADSYAEFERQRNKIIAALAAMDADVIGLMEMENDGFNQESAIADLVSGLNAASGKIYASVNPTISKIGSDAITVGMIYNTQKVTEIGVAATLSTGAFADRNRQPLAQTFREIDSNAQFTVVVNHFKSKGSCPSVEDDANADQGDGQGCWNVLRTEAAEELASWVKSMPTQVAEKDVLLIGDLNSYSMEDPIIALEKAKFKNLLKEFSPQGYSYVFYGQAGSLDHALASSAMRRQVVAATEWHINADEPRILDYNMEYKTDQQLQSLYNSDPYRASDHDPVVIGLNLFPEMDLNNDGSVDNADRKALLENFHHTVAGTSRRYDLNLDGEINSSDLLKLSRAIKQCRAYKN